MTLVPARRLPVGGDAIHYSAADLRVWGTTSQIRKEIEMARLIGTGQHPGYPRGHDFDVPTDREKNEYLEDGRGRLPDEAYWDRVHGVDEKRHELELALAPPEVVSARDVKYDDPTTSEWAGGEDAARVKASAQLGHEPIEAGIVQAPTASADAPEVDITGDATGGVEVEGKGKAGDKAERSSHAESKSDKSK